MISVLILTKNEEKDIVTCLSSLGWCDDIHVLDSFSEDNTVAVATSSGAIVTQRQFDGYASQRNAGLQQIKFKNPWLLIVDADERIPDTLAEELLQGVSAAEDNVNGFRIRRRDYLGQTWLKHSQMTPYYIRLIRLGKALYHREVNEVLEVDGIVETLDGYFDHYPFSKGYAHWLNKHNTYSTMEAKRWLDEHQGNIEFSLQKALFSSDFSEKRYHQKGIFYKIPGRPFIKWIYLVVVRRGFLDGWAGITNATLQAIYEYFIVLKTNELLRKDLVQ